MVVDKNQEYISFYFSNFEFYDNSQYVTLNKAYIKQQLVFMGCLIDYYIKHQMKKKGVTPADTQNKLNQIFI